jgi:predicted lipid-binding transport protein (Tim44 family)
MMNVATETASRISSAHRGGSSSLVAAALLALAAASAHAAPDVYYQCPNNVFTNTITAKEADARGCKSKEAQQPTTIAAPKARPGAVAAPGSAASRVDAQEQKARDTDSRKILQDELIKAQAQLDALQKEYNNGQPERRGDEKNAQKYIDRTNDLKAQIARTESDISAITRELAKTQ